MELVEEEEEERVRVGGGIGGEPEEWIRGPVTAAAECVAASGSKKETEGRRELLPDKVGVVEEDSKGEGEGEGKEGGESDDEWRRWG